MLQSQHQNADNAQLVLIIARKQRVAIHVPQIVEIVLLQMIVENVQHRTPYLRHMHVKMSVHLVCIKIYEFVRCVISLIA